MRIPRFYIPFDMDVGQSLSLPGDTAQHLSRVLRMKPGRKILLFNGHGGEYSASVTDVQRNRVTVNIESYSDHCPESPLKLTLIQSISRSDRMDYTIQKSTELGITHIQPVFSEHGIVKLEPRRLARKQQHWQKIAISACEQSGRTLVPEILTPQNILPVLEQQYSSDVLKLIMHTSDSTASPFRVKDIPAELDACVILAGPEGGLSDLEVKKAMQHDFKIIQLGPRILRTETAAMALISILQARAGDML